MSEPEDLRPAKIALIGCGAIAESFYLPALARYRDYASRLVLVDIHLPRLQKMARDFGVRRFVDDYRKVLGKVDGAIIALPHHLHVPVSVEFLRAGAHVLCEKPLADSLAGAQEMVSAAEKSGKRLLVNNMRRLFPGMIRVKEILADGVIGAPLSFHAEEGFKYEWPTVSGFFFKDPRGGVLGDTGAHTLDLFCWWFGSRPEVASYLDDSFGGNEALCEIDLRFGNKLRGFVKLSRFKRLANKYMIKGTRGTLVCDLADWRANEITLDKGGLRTKTSPPMVYRTFEDLGYAITSNFVEIARGDEDVEPLIEGRDVLDSIAVIDECYRSRKRLDMPWINPSQK